jgi:hypothetical protein
LGSPNKRLPGACIADLGIITSVNKISKKNNKCSPRHCRPSLSPKKFGPKCEVAKAKFWESLTFMFFFTAMLIPYIKGGIPAQIFLERERVCNDEGYICYFFYWFYWLMLLYPGQLYRLLGASNLTWNLFKDESLKSSQDWTQSNEAG